MAIEAVMADDRNEFLWALKPPNAAYSGINIKGVQILSTVKNISIILLEPDISKNADVHIKIIENFAEYINVLSDVLGEALLRYH